MLKKATKLITILIVMFLCIPSLVVQASEDMSVTYRDDGSVLYTRSDSAIEDDVRRQIEERLEDLGINKDECLIITNSITPYNDINNYKTERSSPAIRYTTGYPDGQLSGGVSFGGTSNVGGKIMGSFYYTPSVGSATSVSISFGDPYGVASVSLPIGRVSSTVTQYGVEFEAKKGARYKLRTKTGYQFVYYIVYQKVYTGDMTGYQWREYTGGVTRSVWTVDLSPVML